MSELTGGNTGYCSIENQFTYMSLSTISLNADTLYTYYLYKDLKIPWKVESNFTKMFTWLKNENLPQELLQPAGKALNVNIVVGNKKMICDGKVYFGRLYYSSDDDYIHVIQSKKEFFMGNPDFTGIFPKNGISLTLRSKPENIRLKKWIRGKCLSRSLNIFDTIPKDVLDYILSYLFSYWLVPNFVHVSDELFS